ncbi:MAG: acyl-CoA dehydrogenase family protein, partial [Acidimicrobiia bacterium]
MVVITDEMVAEQVRGWLAANWDPELTVAQWWERLAGSGYAAPTWPEEDFGKGYSRALANIV